MESQGLKVIAWWILKEGKDAGIISGTGSFECLNGTIFLLGGLTIGRMAG